MYGCPIDIPMSLLHINGYSICVNLNFAWDKRSPIAACGICNFATAEAVSNPSTLLYTQALFIIVFHFGIAHTIMLGADKKFYNIFKQMCELLDHNARTTSRGNHDPMLAKRVNIYA